MSAGEQFICTNIRLYAYDALVVDIKKCSICAGKMIPPESFKFLSIWKGSYLLSILLMIVSSTPVRSSTPVIASGNRTCTPPGDRIPLHIRSIMTFESELESGEHALFLQAAAEHVNDMKGILDDYYICFSWDHSTVSKSTHL